MPVEDVEKIIRREPLEDYYEVGSELGRGKFAIVKRCTCKETGQQFASKVLKKRRRGKSCRDDILVEIDIMRQGMDHNRIVKLHEVFESTSEFHIIIELATGGELFRVIAIEPLPEEKAREVVYQIVDGVQHLHTLNIVHLDLKPENILLYRKGSLDIKIADFGLAVQLQKGQEVRNLVGTAEYVAPEILNFEPLSCFSDMWSIGALTYALITGYSPFQGETHQETFLNVSTVDFDFDDELFDPVSQDAKEFIEKLLIKRPNKRMTAEVCLQHPWMKARKSNNLNSSTSSLDSALCMDSASSMEPSPISSTSSSFSPAPSTTSKSTTTTTSTSSSSLSQPEDMKKVNEKLAQISTLATERLVAETAPQVRPEDSPTSTDSSTSTLKEAESSENIPALTNEVVAKKAPELSSEKASLKGKEGTDGKAEEVKSRGSTFQRKISGDSLLERKYRELDGGDRNASRNNVLDGKSYQDQDRLDRSVSTESTLERRSYKERNVLDRSASRETTFDRRSYREGLDRTTSRESTLERRLGRDRGGLDKTTLGESSFERKSYKERVGLDKSYSRNSSTLERSFEKSTERGVAKEGTFDKKSLTLGRNTDLTSLNPKTIESLERYNKLKQRSRPKTPEPQSPMITETKIHLSPERKLRRKSEGMHPIARRLGNFTSEEPTVHEGDDPNETIPPSEKRGGSPLLKTKMGMGGESAEEESGSSPESRRKERKKEKDNIPEIVECVIKISGLQKDDDMDTRARAVSPSASSNNRLSPTPEVARRHKPTRSEQLKQVISNRRKTPVISTEAVDAILRGEVFDDEAEHGEGENDTTVTRPLETCPEEDENTSPTLKRKWSRPDLKTSPIRPRTPEQSVIIGKHPSVVISSSEESSQSIHPETRVSQLSTEPAKGRAKSTSDYYPERVGGNSQDFASPPDTLTHSLRSDGLSRLRASSMVLSHSTPDLTQILAGDKKETSSKRVERSNSRRALGRSRLDSYVTSTSSGRSQMMYSSANTSRSSTRTLPSRIFGSGGLNRAFSSLSKSSRDKDRDRSSRSRHKY